MPVHLTKRLWFPDPRTAQRGGAHDGLVAVGADLSAARLLLAYRNGLFPWTDDPVTWWSPDPRAIFELDHFHISRSLAKIIRKGIFEVTIDRAFREVMEGCAAPGRGRRSTWITHEFLKAYTELHNQGHAHSLECWQEGKLVGGIYGVAIGGFFAGESMFHRVSNASKIALYYLHERLRQRNFSLLDIQMLTEITNNLGAVQISRAEYLMRLANAVGRPSRFAD